LHLLCFVSLLNPISSLKIVAAPNTFIYIAFFFCMGRRKSSSSTSTPTSDSYSTKTDYRSLKKFTPTPCSRLSTPAKKSANVQKTCILLLAPSAGTSLFRQAALPTLRSAGLGRQRCVNIRLCFLLVCSSFSIPPLFLLAYQLPAIHSPIHQSHSANPKTTYLSQPVSPYKLPGKSDLKIMVAKPLRRTRVR
jgi:hypothetical protein